MTLFEQAIASIDEYNKKDPNSETENGVVYPKVFLDSLRQSKWREKLVPNASEALKIATRSQHIGRWEVARSSYPSTRTGYLNWRSDLALFHADKTSEILQKVGYDTTTINRVRELNLKKVIKLDREAQAIEDVLCLVFLENHIESFAPSQEEDVMLNIIRKTWKKMSDLGRAEAMQINYSPEISALLEKALAV
jgi:hypothetical protein